MTLIKYHKPYLKNMFENENDLFDLNPFNDMVKTFFGKDTGSGLVNVFETEKEYNLEFILPGYKKDEVNIQIDKDVLTVKASRENKKEDKSKNYIRKEYVSSSFSRSFTLPEDASEDIKADMNNGILNLNVKKIIKEEKKFKNIEIK